VALYRSLERYCSDFHLYFFAFDDKCFELLNRLDLKYSTVISLKDFENDDLIRVKPTRTIAEYCWTCTPSTIWYSINKYKLDHCTYLDADMEFLASPDPLFQEIGASSVGITPHNFSKGLKSSERFGKYCVQFNYFKNDKDGMTALNWWKDSCLNWCFAKMENGKYGDQKYLDYFQGKFKNVCVISHYGAGVAPWNISNYNIEPVDNIISIKPKAEADKMFPLIFYHYQGLNFHEKGNDIISFASVLKIPIIALQHIYEPYIYRLLDIKNQIDGKNEIHKKIIFKRNVLKSLNTIFRIKLRRFGLIRSLYYFLKPSRYNQPKMIGAILD
jgi:hypothetical protein